MIHAHAHRAGALRAWLLTLGASLAGCGLVPLELGAEPTPDAFVFGDVPQDAIARLAKASARKAEGMRLSLLYPQDHVAVPENLAPLPFVWQSELSPPGMAMPPKAAPTKADAATKAPAASTPPSAAGTAIAYQLRVRGPALDLRLYTTATTLRIPAERWRTLLHDHAGATLTFELSALGSGPNGEVVQAAPLHLQVLGPTPAGVLYAWSTSAQGIVQATLEHPHELRPAETTAVDPSHTQGRCLGCHDVSRDGRHLLAAAGGGSSVELQSFSEPDDALQSRYPVPAQRYVFASFDPTATRIAVAVAGHLRVLDATTGAQLQAPQWPGVPGVTHPDWSPDGRTIAVSLLAQPEDIDPSLAGASIARIAVAADGSLQAPELLVAAKKDEALRFPSHSPDASFIAFERQKLGPAQKAARSSLAVLALETGEISEPNMALRPDHADHPDKDANAGMPSWMPGDRPGRAFLLFAAERSWGLQSIAAGQRQLFASALELSRAAAGMDPSSPAFALPFQQPTSSYRRAVWAPAVRDCSPAREVCDGLDDDCDGQTDEACCEPAAESCGDGIDNDCDGRSDEGCGCAFSEHCANGIDDDCDGAIDERTCTD